MHSICPGIVEVVESLPAAAQSAVSSAQKIATWRSRLEGDESPMALGAAVLAEAERGRILAL